MSVFTYGCETWTINKDIENKINAFEMWIFRKVANVKWSDRVTNEDVCVKLNMERTLLKTIKRRKLKLLRPYQKAPLNKKGDTGGQSKWQERKR